MPRVAQLLRHGRKALEDINLRKVLRTEISHEKSFNPFQVQGDQAGSLGDFTLDWDSPESQDVVLRRKCESGEEVAISALLGPVTFEVEGIFPREVLIKVCVKKPGLSSFLQFGCGVSLRKVLIVPTLTAIMLIITNPQFVPVLPSTEVHYSGEITLDNNLQEALKEYLEGRGIGESLTNFLLFHLHNKEQGQYVNWLH